MGVFKAAPRPVTSHGRPHNQAAISAHQQQILKDIMGGGRQIIRPQTAATTTKKDEERIRKQMSYFEMLEQKIDADLDKMAKNEDAKGDDTAKKRAHKKGVQVTRQMLLNASQCDELHEIQTVS